MREAPPEADLCWRELAIVAKALVDGGDVTEIGLMRDIALRTIAVLRDAGRLWGGRRRVLRRLFAELGDVAGRWRSQRHRSQKLYSNINYIRVRSFVLNG